jgi:membrane associated rhomboid family serine protease
VIFICLVNRKQQESLIQIPPAINIYLTRKNNYGTAYWAHLGGFAVCIFIPLFLRPEAFARYMSDVLV